jgi:cell division inhibitor SepF
MDYLGLGADDAYDDYDMSMEMERPTRPVRGGYAPDPSGRVPRARYEDEYVDPSQTSTVRPLTVAGGEPVTVRPQRFEQAKEIADRFKEGQPVIMNLEAADQEVMRRLIDFASGLCYALNGTMERVASGVYLLKPPASRHSQFD